MDGSDGPRVRQAVVTGDNMAALRKELQFKKGEAFFAANAKELPKESFNRKILVAAHEQGRLAAEQELRKGKHPLEKLVLVTSSAEGGLPQGCSRPLEELALSSLKEIFLPQLEIDKRHRGRVLFGTFCVQPFKMSSLNSVLADKSGKAVRVAICSLPHSMSSKEIEARFATGLKVAIKEPYFKLCADGKVMVRVDNPAELVLVDDSNKEIVFDLEAIIQDADNPAELVIVDDSNKEIVSDLEAIVQELDKIRAEGKRLVAQKSWSGAIEQYSECIARCSTVVGGSDNKAIQQCLLLAFSNRSEVWLQLLNFKNALDDANKALEFDPEHQKSRSRRERAWQGFGKVQIPASKVKVPIEDPSVVEFPVRTEKDGPKGKPSDVSKSKVVERKSTSASSNASKVKLIESKDTLPAPSTTSKGRLSDAKSDPPLASKGKTTSSSKRKQGVPPIALGGQAPDSTSKGEQRPPGSSKVRLTDADGNEPGSNVTEERLVDPRDDSSPPLSSSKANVIDTKSVSPPPEEVEERSTAESQNEPGGAMDCEGALFATWLDSIRSSGDALLTQGKWIDAIRKYDKVTEVTPPKKNRDKVIQTLLLGYSHRSEAWIWLGNYENSLRDANAALEFVDRYPKSVAGYDAKHLLNEVRRGRAFHGLGEYREACSIFTAALAKSPNEKSIKDLLEKSKICYEQSRDGIYNLDEYFLDGCRGPPPPCSDFVGPVEIRRVPGKGRGLFLTRSVDAGDLLLVSNPLAVVRRRIKRQGGGGGDAEEDYSFLTTKWRRNNGNAVGFDDFVGRLALLQSQRKMYQLYTLSSGHLHEKMEIPDINVFIPGSSFELPPSWENVNTDLERLRSIVRLNAIDGGLNPLDGAFSQDGEDDEAIGCVGLWALPSFMNHSCVPNCHMMDVGNAMFVRASRNICEGEELTRAYFYVYLNGLDRHRSCEEWLFVCNCERCSLEKALTAQRVLPLHEYRNLLERVREESTKRVHSGEKDRSLSLLLPNPQLARLQLRKFADWFDMLLSQADGLGNKEKAWIGASHLEAYSSRLMGSKDKNQFILALENMLEFMTNTAILGMGHTENALARASLLLELVEGMYGSGTLTYRRIETRVLDLYGTAYGALRKEVLLTMSRLMR